MTRTLARWIVRLVAVVVPGTYRDRFVDEWSAELYYESSGRRALERSLGAFRDALSTRRLIPERRRRPTPMLFQDIRFALRSFLHRPWWTAVVLLTLAVGIGANTAIFSLFETVLLRPLDYPASEELVKIVGRNRATGERNNISPADFYDFESETVSFDSMGAHGWVGFFTITGGGEPERVAGTQVTAGFFRTLGVNPSLGRVFAPEDDEHGAPPTAVLTDGFWQRRFGGDAGVIGSMVTVDAVAHEIIGVLPASYRHPEPNPDREPALYRLYQFERGGRFRSGRFIRGLGRLRDGATLDEAQVELEALALRLEETYPESNTDRGVRVLALKDAIVTDARTGLLVLLGAVGGVLLLACANVANLQLASGSTRRQELAIKAALGAGRGRLIRQLVTESLVLALMGGAAGVVVAYWASSLLALRTIPRAEDLGFSASVFAFAFVASTLAALLFGLFPALALSSGDLSRARKQSRPRQILIGFEVAASLVLLVGAGLLMKSLNELESVAPGFDRERVLTMQTSLPTASYEEGDQIPFYASLYEKLEPVPGVSAVGAINILPLSQNYSSDGFQIEDRPVPKGEAPSAEARSVNNDYFRAMGISLMKGRVFDERDASVSPGVIVISEAMAERFWPGEDPIGERITYNRGLDQDVRQEVGGPGSREIVGIVGNVKHRGLDDADVSMFYTPYTQQPSYHTMTLVLRTNTPPEVVAGTVRSELEAMDANIPLYAVRPLDDVVDQTVNAPRFRTYVLGVFAVLALVLAIVGVYAVMGVSVIQRTQEIGIRMALGAAASSLVRMLVAQSMKPVLWGLGIGLVAALAMARLLDSLLFNVTATDVTVYTGVAVVLALAALAASFVPTLKAMRIDPVKTLKAD